MGIFNKMSGVCGEDAACSFLKKKKYKIVERNFRTKSGEIDIVARQGEDLVFVEVKTRTSDKTGTPAEAVTYYKKQKIVNCAKYYLMMNPTGLNIRFDVIEVYGRFSDGRFDLDEIKHLENVFYEV